jgi:polyphenol oxidase
MRITDELLQSNDISHGFFGRRGGVSTGIYNSLNCGLGSDDDPEAVHENRKRVAEELGTAPEKLLTLHQIHSDICLTVTAPWTNGNRPQADAMVTNVPGIALGTLTADCAPILLAGRDAKERPVIGTIHAGWRGALKGIIQKTVEAMGNLGAPPESISASIGPCLGPQSYEVQNEFRDAFRSADKDNDDFFRLRARKIYFNLPSYSLRQLERAEISNIGIRPVDTYADEQNYFSYRRSIHCGETEYGRQIAAIMIRR